MYPPWANTTAGTLWLMAQAGAASALPVNVTLTSFTFAIAVGSALRAPQRAPPMGSRSQKTMVAVSVTPADFKIRSSVRMLLSIDTVRTSDDPILAVRLYRVTVNLAMEGEDGWSMASDLVRSSSSRRTKK